MIKKSRLRLALFFSSKFQKILDKMPSIVYNVYRGLRKKNGPNLGAFSEA